MNSVSDAEFLKIAAQVICLLCGLFVTVLYIQDDALKSPAIVVMAKGLAACVVLGWFLKNILNGSFL